MYVGNSELYFESENFRCPGGPYMSRWKDEKSYSYDAEADLNDGDDRDGLVWNYGTEVWCSHSGRYVHIMADLRHLKD